MNRPVTTATRDGAVVIEAEADIRRSAEEVFDYASDPASEPEWNIRVKRVQKLTGGPIGVGARYRIAFTQGPPATSECVRFDRPGYWEHAVSAARWCPRMTAATCCSGCGSGHAGCRAWRCPWYAAGCSGSWPVT